MSAYLPVVKSAIIAFPFVALLLSLPIFAYQYRKNESFIVWRAVVIYSFIFYLLTAYFLVILPLPSQASVAALTTPKMNLHPFEFVRQFIAYSPFKLADPSTYKATLLSASFIQPAFNLLLTVPFGIYLRYYFKRSWWQTILLGFGFSLFFELTQLSGLYGYYVRPYRLFDVDDLLLNTSGAFVGFLIAPLLTRMFPTSESLEQRELQAASRVSVLRRFVAFIVDAAIYSLGMWAVSILIRQDALAYLVTVLVLFFLVPNIKNGQTLGMMFVRIKVANNENTELSRSRLFWRQAQLWLIIMPFIFGWTVSWLSSTGTVSEKFLPQTLLVALVLVLIVLIYLIHIFVGLFMKNPRLIYEKISKTRTIAVKKDRSNE